MICIVYSRVSTEDQERHGFSIPEQKEKGEAKAKALGYAQDQIIHLGDNMTGDLLEERPGLSRARELIRAGGVGHFVCYDPDRFSRKAAYALILLEEIEKGAQVVFVNSDYQNSLDGKLFFGMRAVIAEFDKGKILMRTQAGRITKAKKGEIPQFTRCYGFAYDKEKDALSIHPIEGQVVKDIYAWFLSGWTYYRIAEELNGTGVPAARGGKWVPRMIVRLLSRPIYKGDYIVRRYNTEGVRVSKHKAPADRIKVRERPKSEHIHIPVPAIIDEITWERAQAEIRRRREFKPGHPKLDYALSGLCRCGYCGAHLYGMGQRWKREGKRGQIWRGEGRYYVCANKGGRKGRNCILCYRRADALEAEVWSEVAAFVKNPQLFAEAIGGMETEQGPRLYEAMQKQAKELAEERGRLIDLYVRNLIPKEDADRRLAEMKKREEFLARRLEDLKPRPAMAFDEAAFAAEFGQYAADLDNATLEEKKRFFRAMIAYVLVWNDKIRIIPRTDAGSAVL